jgi:hypothetical protein
MKVVFGRMEIEANDEIASMTRSVLMGLRERDLPGALLAAMEVVATIYERIEHEGDGSIVVDDWNEEINSFVEIYRCNRNEMEARQKHTGKVIRLKDIRPFRAPS